MPFYNQLLYMCAKLFQLTLNKQVDFFQSLKFLFLFHYYSNASFKFNCNIIR